MRSWSRSYLQRLRLARGAHRHVPLVGPLIVKILALPFIWLLNAIGYVISLVAIRRGFSKDVLTYRGLTMASIVGIVIGYVVGKFV